MTSSDYVMSEFTLQTCESVHAFLPLSTISCNLSPFKPRTHGPICSRAYSFTYTRICLGMQIGAYVRSYSNE